MHSINATTENKIMVRLFRRLAQKDIPIVERIVVIRTRKHKNHQTSKQEEMLAIHSLNHITMSRNYMFYPYLEILTWKSFVH